MQKSSLFFIGLFMLACMLGLLFFAGAIYDAEKKYSIDTFFFEPASKSANRVAVPVSADDMPDNFLRDMIISRFVNEYFYVIPNSKNAENRAKFQDDTGKTTALYGLAGPGHTNVYEDWKKNVSPEIIRLAGKRALRTVQVVGFGESESGHLIVEYELKTWNSPNDVMAMPDVTRGVLYMDITKNPIHVLQTADALKRLQDGVDPVSAFNFGVLDVIQQ